MGPLKLFTSHWIVSLPLQDICLRRSFKTRSLMNFYPWKIWVLATTCWIFSKTMYKWILVRSLTPNTTFFLFETASWLTKDLKGCSFLMRYKIYWIKVICYVLIYCQIICVTSKNKLLLFFYVLKGTLSDLALCINIFIMYRYFVFWSCKS